MHLPGEPSSAHPGRDAFARRAFFSAHLGRDAFARRALSSAWFGLNAVRLEVRWSNFKKDGVKSDNKGVWKGISGQLRFKVRVRDLSDDESIEGTRREHNQSARLKRKVSSDELGAFLSGPRGFEGDEGEFGEDLRCQ